MVPGTRSLLSLAVLLLGCVMAAPRLDAQSAAEVEPTTAPPALSAGVVESPPFAYPAGDGGSWTGVGVELVEGLAARLERSVEWRPQEDADTALESLTDGRVDLVVGVGVPEDERGLEVGHPYFVGGHGVAVRGGRSVGVMDILKLFGSWDLLPLVGGLLVVIAVAGTAMWLVERRLEDHEHFGEKPREGLAAGVWWAVVTMTGVGYGDTLPKSTGGRAAAVTWMLMSLVLVAAFTASVTSKLTLAGFEKGVRRVEDLAEVTSIVVTGSPTDERLKESRLRVSKVETLDQALDQLEKGEVRAVAHPREELCHAVSHGDRRELRVLALSFGRRDHVLLAREGVLDPSWNARIRDEIASDEWDDVVFRHLGC